VLFRSDSKAKKIKEAWEKLYGKDTCEVVVLDPDENIVALV